MKSKTITSLFLLFSLIANSQVRKSAIDEDVMSESAIEWYGCGISMDSSDTDCNSAHHKFEWLEECELTIKTTKDKPESHWKPVGISFEHATESEIRQVIYTYPGFYGIEFSYENTSSSYLDIFYQFISSSDGGATVNITNADLTGNWWGKYSVYPGEKISFSNTLDNGRRTSWEYSESECVEKFGIWKEEGKCIWDDGFVLEELYAIEFFITGAISAETAWVPTPIEEASIKIDFFKGVDLCDPWSSNEIGFSNFKLFPNPTNDLINVSFESNSASIIELVDLTGKVVSTTAAEAGTVNTQFTTTNINAGVYYVNVKNENGSTTSKVVVK